MPVLVRARQKECVDTEHALAPGNGIAHECGIRVTNVRARIDVINGSGDVKLGGLIHFPCPGRS